MQTHKPNIETVRNLKSLIGDDFYSIIENGLRELDQYLIDIENHYDQRDHKGIYESANAIIGVSSTLSGEDVIYSALLITKYIELEVLPSSWHIDNLKENISILKLEMKQISELLQ